jgi:hypothetical protein
MQHLWPDKPLDVWKSIYGQKAPGFGLAAKTPVSPMVSKKGRPKLRLVHRGDGDREGRTAIGIAITIYQNGFGSRPLSDAALCVSTVSAGPLYPGISAIFGISPPVATD